MTTYILIKILVKRDIKVTFPPPITMRNMPNKVKDQTNPIRHKRIYVIRYNFVKVYIGKTRQSI